MKLSISSVFLLIVLTLSCHILSCHSSRKTTSNPQENIIKLPPRNMEAGANKEAISMEKTDPFMEDLLNAHPQHFSAILKNRDSMKVQIIYTQINRDVNNQPLFRNYYFHLDPEMYFYPASTVKLPVALLSLQRLNELKVFGLNSQSTMITEAAYSGQTPVYNDATTEDGRPSIANYIKKIFLVSDNDAYNRLYEFLGQEYINAQLSKMGYEAQIRHRLDIFLSEDENRHTNPVKFLTPEGRNLYQQPMQFNQQVYPARKDFIGKGYYSGESVIKTPLDFSIKNRIRLEDLHEILKSVLFPEAVPARQRFNLKEEDYRFVLKYMSQLPSETSYPLLDSTRHWDAYVKFLLYGNEKMPMPPALRIFNKVGDAYGFLTDVAYVVDFDKNIEFMLSASIYCNSDGILNDDNYEYETVGFPFMKQLGQVIYEYEVNRERPRQPDLSKFKLLYDK
jgi:hypothetical protein